MPETISPKPPKDQPTLPGYSIEALNLLPELRNRVAELAAREHISDQEALNRITNEEHQDAADDRAKNHAP